MANILFGGAIVFFATAYVYLLATIPPGTSIPADHVEGPGSGSCGLKCNNSNLLSDQLKFPTSLNDITRMSRLLTFYKENYFSYVLLLFCSAYLYKQCFAIPGSVFMNLLAGALFGVAYGFPLCCFLTACGASGCYLMSKHFGKDLVERWLRSRLLPLQRKVDEHRDSLFGFLLFLRLFPMSPNWFLNIASPLLNVPLKYFFPSVLLGLMPYNFITVEAGAMISCLVSLNDLFTLGTLSKLAGISALALGFLLMKRYFRPAVIR